MSLIPPNANPFYALLSGALYSLRGGLSISLTDKRGDTIAQTTVGEANGAPTDDELSLIRVYGQLAYQQAPQPITELMVERETKRWSSRRLLIDKEEYDLWLVSLNDMTHAATAIEVSETLKSLENRLVTLLSGRI